MAKILLVDDEPEVAGLMSDWLRLRGYDVLRAADGVEALQMARRDGPDLILLDAFMPGLDGLETGRRLRAQPETRHMPIVLIAGEDAASAQVDRLMAGASDAVTRPVALEDLGRRMRALLSGETPPEDRADSLARGAVAAAVAGLPCQMAWLFGAEASGGWASRAAAAPGHPDVLPMGRAAIAIPADDTGWLARPLIGGVAEFNIPLSEIQSTPDDAILGACRRVGAEYVTLIPLAAEPGAASPAGLLLLASREALDTAQGAARRALLGVTHQAGMAVNLIPRPSLPIRGEKDQGQSGRRSADAQQEEQAHEKLDRGETALGISSERRFESLREATLAALTAPNLDVALQVIISQTARALNARLTAILLRPERESETLVIHRAVGLRARKLEDTPAPLAGSLAGAALDAGKPVLFKTGDAARTDIEQIEARTETPVAGAAAAPLVVRGEAAGALLAINRREGAFGQEDVDLLQSLANLTSIAIGGARLAADMAGRANGLSVLHRAAEASSAQPVPALLDSITRLVMDGLGVKACAIRGWDARHGELVTLARRTDIRRNGVQPRTFLLGDWPAARQAIDTGAVVRVSGSRQEKRGGIGMHSLMLYPLPAGMLAVMGHPSENQVFDEEHVTRCKDAAEDWAAMQPPGSDRAGAAGQLADRLLDAVEAPWCVIYMLSQDGGALVRAAEVGHISFGASGPEAYEVGRDSLRRALLGGRKTVAVGHGDDRLTDSDRAIGSPFAAGISLIAPIHYFGEAVGLIEAIDDNPARHFAEHDRLILQAVASLIGAALGRERVSGPGRQPLRPETEQAAPLVLEVPEITPAPPPAEPLPVVETLDGLTLRRTIAALENVARIALDALRPSAEQAGVSLLSFFGEFLPDIYIDRERVLLVFKIILDNAIKYSPHGGRVTLTIREVGQMLHVEIADHGIGIPLEEQSKIWARGEAASIDAVHGLALASRVVKAHGGRIWLVSQPNVGSTFAFSLPTPELSGMGDFIPAFENNGDQ